MNKSGQAVGAMCTFFKSLPNELLVAFDELDFEVGTVKFKIGGSSSQNGIRDTVRALANQKDFLAASAVSLFAVSLRSLLFSLSRCLGRCLRLAARSFLATVDSKTDIVAAHCWILSPRLSSLHQTVLLEAPLNYKR
jgi:hypothetical protein